MKKNSRFLSPSLLSADFSDLNSAFKFIEEKGSSFVHVDVMDGHFVPQVSYGQPVISSIRKCTKLPFDVHLMIERPENSIVSYIESGADIVTFHIEATCHADRCVQLVHNAGKKAGIALCPATPLSAVEELLPFVDLVLVMSVNPGWAGQKLIPYTIEKIRKLADIQREKNFKYLISVDGGINQETLEDVLEAGTDIVVSGSSFFRGNLEWK
ncbi:ribulose-phosphate 3-epimerase [uncultured Treponema sp.]|uniref:ribulose-phosphate 3-epimerase n=1 Tax=uncultured Treponema sp. TaxID=162155 RepID=UPI00280A62ED|nr:ribulose-phosphate 3-epimerase [uncultured Treponema sp.]